MFWSRKDWHLFYLNLRVKFFHEAGFVERIMFGIIGIGLLILLLVALMRLLTARDLLDASLSSLNAAAAAAEPAFRLRVATYNLWSFAPIWEVRKQRISEMLDEFDFDIIGLQEGDTLTI